MGVWGEVWRVADVVWTFEMKVRGFADRGWRCGVACGTSRASFGCSGDVWRFGSRINHVLHWVNHVWCWINNI